MTTPADLKKSNAVVAAADRALGDLLARRTATRAALDVANADQGRMRAKSVLGQGVTLPAGALASARRNVGQLTRDLAILEASLGDAQERLIVAEIAADRARREAWHKVKPTRNARPARIPSDRRYALERTLGA